VKKLLALVFFIVGAYFAPITAGIYNQYTAADQERIVMLIDFQGGHCTGFNVKAPSGKMYIMTAAHCYGLSEKGLIYVKRPGMAPVLAKIIAAQPEADLMVLEYIGGPYFDISAREVELREELHTWSYGRRSPAWPSDGFLIKKNLVIRIPNALIVIDETTVKVQPGSSGGPMLNANREIVGVISVMNENENAGIVPLANILQFLESL